MSDCLLQFVESFHVFLDSANSQKLMASHLDHFSLVLCSQTSVHTLNFNYSFPIFLLFLKIFFFHVVFGWATVYSFLSFRAYIDEPDHSKKVAHVNNAGLINNGFENV